MQCEEIEISDGGHQLTLVFSEMLIAEQHDIVIIDCDRYEPHEHEHPLLTALIHEIRHLHTALEVVVDGTILYTILPCVITQKQAEDLVGRAFSEVTV